VEVLRAPARQDILRAGARRGTLPVEVRRGILRVEVRARDTRPAGMARRAGIIPAIPDIAAACMSASGRGTGGATTPDPWSRRCRRRRRTGTSVRPTGPTIRTCRAVRSPGCSSRPDSAQDGDDNSTRRYVSSDPAILDGGRRRGERLGQRAPLPRATPARPWARGRSRVGSGGEGDVSYTVR
jgi:hypothetical protein